MDTLRSRTNTIRIVLGLLLVCASTFGTGCFGLPGGGGGGITPTPTFLSGTYKSDQGKIFVFADDGSYEFFPDEAKQSSQEPELSSKYEVLDGDIFFERADGSKFSEPGKLAADSGSFTWSEYPGETFTKVQ